MRKVIVLGIILSCFSGCQETEDLSLLRDDTVFFPLVIGTYIDYAVVERNYDAQGNNEITYFLRELVEDTVTDLEGQLSYRIRRFVRNDVDEDWRKESIYLVQQTGRRTRVDQDGLAQVKQIYPIQNGVSWDANVQNNLGEGLFTYSRVFQDTTINDSSFNRTIRVVLDPPSENLTERISRYEIYAEGIGLLVKDYTSLKFNTIQGDENEGEVSSGFELKQQVIAYGTE